MGTQTDPLTCREFKTVRTSNGVKDVSLFGAIPSDRQTVFDLFVPRRLGACGVRFAIRRDGTGDERAFAVGFTGLLRGDDIYSFSLDPAALACSGDDGVGLYYYRWEVSTPLGVYSFGGEDPTELEAASGRGEQRQLLIFRPFVVSERFLGGIVYQIFPDRFRRSGRCTKRADASFEPDWDGGTPPYADRAGDALKNDVFFGGDLYGVAEKLDYIASLGVTAIYLNPVFESFSNHRYDTGDMLKTDEALGSDAALFKLIKDARRRGISVILDGVFNHTGDDSVYFNKYGRYPSVGAYNSKDSEYYRWYFFDEHPDNYKSWWGIPILPKVNCDEPAYREFIKEKFLKKWCSAGVFGWRIDVADELSDPFLSFFRKAFRSYVKDGVVIGEVWEDASDKISYGSRRRFLWGDELDSVMDYPLREAIIEYVLSGDTEKLRRATEGRYRRYPKLSSDASLNVLGTHDTERILTALGDDPGDGLSMKEKATRKLSPEKRMLAKRRLKAAYSLICALPGVPSVYYGDEVGAEGYSDPFCRRTFPWGREDGELLSFFREAGKERREEPLFSSGLFCTVHLDERIFVFLRYPWENEADHALLTVFNRTESEIRFDLPEGAEPVSSSDGRSLSVPGVSVRRLRLKTSAVKALIGKRLHPGLV